MADISPTDNNTGESDTEDYQDKAKLQKNLIWDDILIYASTFGLALSFIGVGEELLTDRSLACNTPLYINQSRDQLNYVILWCSRHVRLVEELPLLILFQSLCLLGPHVIWEAYSSPAFKEFFSAILQVRRMRKKTTGFYDDDNLRSIRNIMDRYTKTHSVYKSYSGKLLAQVLSSCVFLPTILGVYRGGKTFDSDIFCPAVGAGDSDTSLVNVSEGVKPFTVWCTYASSQYLFPIWIANVLLLLLTSVVTIAGMRWLYMDHWEKLNYQGRCDYYYSLGITYGTYHPKPRRRSETKIRNDLQFLMMFLFRVDQGQGEGFRDLIVDLQLQERWTKDYERYQVFASRRELSSTMVKRRTHVAHTTNGDEFCICGLYLSGLCRQCLGEDKVQFDCALHLFTGSKGCTLALASLCKEIFAVDFNQYYRPDVSKSTLKFRKHLRAKITEEVFHNITVFRVPANITNATSPFLAQFTSTLRNARQRPGFNRRLRKFDLIVVTCLEPHFRASTTRLILENLFHQCTADGCVIIFCAFTLETIETILTDLQVYCDECQLTTSSMSVDLKRNQDAAEFNCAGQKVDIYFQAVTFNASKYN